jgi:NMD protein affecting ribosome stability and mRNA decay
MKTDRGGWRPLRRDELRDELVHDAYQAQQKLPQPTRCPDCGAVYQGGRWQWTTAPVDAHPHSCPACRRIHDRLPAGFVTLAGDFFAMHRDEIMHLVRHCEQREKAEHPLQRIMAVEDAEAGVLVTTTDPHLARDIGEAVHAAYRGELEFHYNKQENLLRVNWHR